MALVVPVLGPTPEKRISEPPCWSDQHHVEVLRERVVEVVEGDLDVGDGTGEPGHKNV